MRRTRASNLRLAFDGILASTSRNENANAPGEHNSSHTGVCALAYLEYQIRKSVKELSLEFGHDLKS